MINNNIFIKRKALQLAKQKVTSKIMKIEVNRMRKSNKWKIGIAIAQLLVLILILAHDHWHECCNSKPLCEPVVSKSVVAEPLHQGEIVQIPEPNNAGLIVLTGLLGYRWFRKNK